jgi:two-component system nitrate/nitrite sensor histidine kinase NarX
VRENLRSTVMNERQMMANEVHDSLAQTLAYVKMRMTLLREAMAQHDDVRSFKYFSDVDQAVGNAYSSLREILAHFRYRMDAGGLLHALRAIVEGFHDKTGVVLELDNQVSDISLSVDQEVQVFHIVQEALANITRHAGATRARLVLAQLDGRYEITIAVCASSRGGNSHFGIDIMKERARRLGGYIEVRGLPGQGTRVHLTFPAPIRVNETGR